MDAISFVMGVRARHLRGEQLKDLIYHEGEPDERRRAHVRMVFELSDADAAALNKPDGDDDASDASDSEADEPEAE